MGRASRHFNPRHPYGWRRERCITWILQKLFQSTPPIRVATGNLHRKEVIEYISIHATHTGGDITELTAELERYISIHATHTGGDMALSVTILVYLHFNPRHPYGWRLGETNRRTVITHFNPRHPYGWRQERRISADGTRLFQSTPPIRVATSVTILVYLRWLNFNPRHPYGWRLTLVYLLALQISFQSTPPIRVATALNRQANLEVEFQSTPPIRVATAGL